MAVRPVIIRDEDALVALLRGRRQALGISQQELDDRVGWPDCYCAKVESPGRSFGKRVAWGVSVFLAYWLEALGLALVVMDKVQADALIAASTDPDMVESVHQPYPGRTRRRELVQTRRLRFSYCFPRQAA
jgi:hypothetical protein